MEGGRRREDDPDTSKSMDATLAKSWARKRKRKKMSHLAKEQLDEHLCEEPVPLVLI